MVVELHLQKHIALGQKSKDDPGLYGQGFNYHVEAAVAWNEEREAFERHFADVLIGIDHRLLGLDSLAVKEPTTANICAWIFAELQKRGCAVTAVRLVRGDGLEARCRA